MHLSRKQDHVGATPTGGPTFIYHRSFCIDHLTPNFHKAHVAQCRGAGLRHQRLGVQVPPWVPISAQTDP